MALIEEKSLPNQTSFIKFEDVPVPKKYHIVKTEIKTEFDRFKKTNVERIYIHLEETNGGQVKVFPIQNEANLKRMQWNFGEEIKNWAGQVTIYKTAIEVRGQVKSVLRIQYNLIDKIKI